MLCLRVPDAECYCEYGQPRRLRVAGTLTDSNADLFEHRLRPAVLQGGDLLVDLGQVSAVRGRGATLFRRLAQRLPDGRLILRWPSDVGGRMWPVASAVEGVRNVEVRVQGIRPHPSSVERPEESSGDPDAATAAMSRR
jgi:hypothetical protein